MKEKKVIKNLKEEINEKNLEIYEKYLCSCYLKSKDTINTTYKIYKSNMFQFMRYFVPVNMKCKKKIKVNANF